MPSIGTPEQSNVVTWRVISTGTAIVVAIFVIFWLARTAASERALIEQHRLDEMAAESRAVFPRREVDALVAEDAFDYLPPIIEVEVRPAWLRADESVPLDRRSIEPADGDGHERSTGARISNSTLGRRLARQRETEVNRNSERSRSRRFTVRLSPR